MDVLMPQLGETVAEGKISAWFKKPGERVSPGDNLFEVETDKTAMEVPATIAGVVAEIRVAAGDTVPVGTVVAVIADGTSASAGAPSSAVRGAESAAIPVKAITAAPLPKPLAAQSRTLASTPYDPFREVRTPVRNFGPARLASGTAVTPLARRLAAEAGLDPATIAGSGPHGRIVALDVERARSSSRGGPLTATPVTSTPAPFEVRPISPAQVAFAAAVAHAKKTVPHFHVHRDVALGPLLQLIKEINTVAGGNLPVTVVDCVIKALAIALQKFPAANASWTDDAMLRYRQCDIAIAVPAAGAVALPVIRAADAKGVAAIAADRAALSERGRADRLLAEELSGGTATVWDLGAFPVRSFAPIVLPPHATALAIGAASKRPALDGDCITVATQITLTLGCDHRVIDGVLGAQLLGACAHALERPLALVL